MNMRPSVAHVTPTGKNWGSVVTTSDVNPGSLNVCAWAKGRGNCPTAQQTIVRRMAETIP